MTENGGRNTRLFGNMLLSEREFEMSHFARPQKSRRVQEMAQFKTYFPGSVIEMKAAASLSLLSCCTRYTHKKQNGGRRFFSGMVAEEGEGNE